MARALPPGRHPLSDAQAEKWLGSRYSDGASLAFGEGCELAFDGRLDADVLSVALQRAADRHQALSMRFEVDGGSQVHEPPSGIALRRRDFHAEADPAAAYAAFCDERASIPFDPARPPLVEAWLCRLAPQEWRLLLRAHHLVFDGWSLRIVLQDLAAFYNEAVGADGGRPAPVDSWIDYVHAERATRDGEAGRRSLAYWLDQYRDLPEPLRLPTDHPRGRQLDFAAATLEQEIPAPLWRGLRSAAREQGVTRFSLLLAGCYLLMHRLSGQDDLVCGVPFAGAARGSGRRLVGDTVSTLPLRMRMLPDEPLPAFVRRTHAALRDAALHQDVSLGRIVDALALVREPGRLLLVDSILSLNPAIERLGFHGVDCRMRVLPHRASGWELAWQWRPLPGKAVLELQYHTALYHPATAHAWCEAYIELLGQMLQAGDIPVADVGAAAPISPASSLADMRGNDWTPGASLPILLESSFAEFGDRCAAQCGDRGIGYAALDEASRAAACALVARGVGPGQLVGICMGRSIDMLVAVLAVLRSGAAYVPLDPAFPAQRLAWMAGHAGLALVVASTPSTIPEGVAAGREVLALADLVVEGVADPCALPRVDGNSLAYVLYTSGSTGQPKGVRITHRNLVNFLAAMREAPGFGRDDAICAATTLSFDIAALELYLPLLCGGRVVIADDDEHRDPEALSRLIERRGCTVFQTTPTLLSLLREVGRDHVLRPLKLLVGGEALPPALATALAPRCRELWNLYGPTETTVWSCAMRLQPGAREVPLGVPVANTRIHLLDARQRPVLPGAIGEIWIGGAGVADGYLHAPGLSAERFVEDPFAGDGSRMYRSGDLGRIRDGLLFFHGRVDSQVKLRGFRIEPGEIEAAATMDADVAECAAIVREAGNGDGELVLYAGSKAEPAALRRRLRARLDASLPAYMRPHRIEVLPRLPRTPNGKLDRRALPAPVVDNAEPAVAATAPRDAIERELVDTWERLFGRGPVGIHDNFFELGGYSLLAVRMFAQLRARHGVDLPLAALVEHPTVASLGQALRAAIAAQAGTVVEDGRGPPVQPSGTLLALRAGGAGVPVFLIHAVGGHVLNYLPVARALPPGRPVYGLQSPGLNDAGVRLSTIDAMADRYAREIRQAWPGGPYLLAGGSMGGVLAVEVARRLRAGGGAIALLGLFDTYGPDLPQRAGESPWRPHRWPALYRRLGPEQRAWLWRRIGFRLWRLPLLRAWQWLGGSPSRELRIHMVERANQLALAAHRLDRYDGRVVLFRATRGTSAAPALGWERVVAGVDVVDIDASHDDIIEQPQLAERFSEWVEAS